jgi:hypothetical protein
LPKQLDKAKFNLEETKHLLTVAKEEVGKPFAQLDELRQKEAKLEALNKELSFDNHENNINNATFSNDINR